MLRGGDSKTSAEVFSLTQNHHNFLVYHSLLDHLELAATTVVLIITALKYLRVPFTISVNLSFVERLG